MITKVFSIDDNAVLPEDMPQTLCSKKKYEWIKSSIEKHENQIFLVIVFCILCTCLSVHFLA